MPPTAMRSLIAVLLALVPALPAAAQSVADKTLRLAPHADLSIIDPYFSGVYLSRYPRLADPGAVEHREAVAQRPEIKKRRVHNAGRAGSLGPPATSANRYPRR